MRRLHGRRGRRKDWFNLIIKINVEKKRKNDKVAFMRDEGKSTLKNRSDEMNNCAIKNVYSFIYILLHFIINKRS